MQVNFKKTRDEVAERIWLIGAADQMIEAEDAKRRFESHKNSRSQSFGITEHYATSALIALKEMGLLKFD